MRGSIYPREETTYEELKGHRSFSKEELPRLSQTGTIGYGNRPSRQFISKYACGMLNTGKGGLISMGILDTGRIEGFSLSRYQQDHVRLSIQDTFDRYDPPVPPHLYKVTFRPVLDCIDGQSPEDELEAMNKWLNIESEQDPTFQHLVRTLEPCWCDSGALAAFSCGVLNPFFVVELQLEAWNQNDPRNAKLFPKDPSGPNFKAEDGVNYMRRFASNAVAMTQKQT